MRDHTRWLSTVEKVLTVDPVAYSREQEIEKLESMARCSREAARMIVALIHSSRTSTGRTIGGRPVPVAEENAHLREEVASDIRFALECEAQAKVLKGA